MKRNLFDSVLPALFAIALAHSPTLAGAGDVGFTSKPAVNKASDATKITFTLSAPTDVEVSVTDAGGKVVRHLAAGYLGATNTPPAPLKPGLAQEIVWDGRTDTGQAATNGPFRVRARAGLGVKFDGFLGEDLHFMAFPRGLAVDRSGNLYVYSAPVGNRWPDGAPSLQAFDRAGKYLRTIMPMPANLPAAKAKPFQAAVRADGDFTPANFASVWPVFYPGVSPNAHVFSSTLPDSGAFHLATLTTFARLGPDGGAVGDWFSRELWPKGGRPSDNAVNWRMAGPNGLSVSPDGKTAYISGPYIREGADQTNFPPSRIYRLDVESGKIEKFADLKNGKIPGASGLDKDGNLLVCHPGPGLVTVLSPAGAEIGEIKLPSAAAVACHRKTGAVYVLCYKASENYVAEKTVVKLSGWKDAREIARIDLRREGGVAAMALDDSADPPVLWVASSCTKGGSCWNLGAPATVVRLEEREGKFVDTPHEIKFPATAALVPTRMAVHPEDDKVLCRGEYCAAAAYEGLTGQPIKLPFRSCLDMGVGLDGNWYLQPIETWAGPLARYDRNFNPLPGSDGSNTVGYAYGRFGWGLGSFGLTADAKGRVYSLAQVNEHVDSGLCVAVFGPDGRPEDPGRLKGDPRITKKHKFFESALVSGLGPGGSIALDWKGNIYIGQRAYPMDWKPPAGFEKDMAHWQCTGSVLKFKPEGGSMMGLGGPESRPFSPAVPIPAGKEGLTLHQKNCYPSGPSFAENAVKAYPGLSCLSGSFGYTGCACRQPMFQLDGWGRLFIPSALDCSVQVVDNEGNEILRFGAYGNADSRGPGADSPIKKPDIPLGWPEAVGASDKAVYVADVLNRRIVRLLKTYAAESAVDVK